MSINRTVSDRIVELSLCYIRILSHPNAGADPGIFKSAGALRGRYTGADTGFRKGTGGPG